MLVMSVLGSKWLLVLTILLLGTLVELAVGSSPPGEFFHPVPIALFLMLYGAGALLVRELALLTQSGWFGRAVLGFGYGIIEEGLCCKSFCDPAWGDLGRLQGYDHFLGINWIWTPYLTVFHGLFSICLVLLISDLMFPHLTDELVTGARSRAFLFSSLGLVTVFGFFTFPHTPDRNFTFWPPVFWIVVFIVEIAAAYGLARLWGAGNLRDTINVRNLRVPPWLLGFLVFVVTALFFTGMNIAPSVLPALPAAGAILSYILLAAVLGVLVLLFYRNPEITWRHQLAAVWGVLVLFAVIGPLQELDASRPDNTSGMAIVGLGILAFLAMLTVAVARRHRSTTARSDSRLL